MRPLEDVVDVFLGDVEDGWVALWYYPSCIDTDESQDTDECVSER